MCARRDLTGIALHAPPDLYILLGCQSARMLLFFFCYFDFLNHRSFLVGREWNLLYAYWIHQILPANHDQFDTEHDVEPGVLVPIALQLALELGTMSSSKLKGCLL